MWIHSNITRMWFYAKNLPSIAKNLLALTVAWERIWTWCEQSSYFQTWCRQIAFLPQKIVKNGYFIEKIKNYGANQSARRYMFSRPCSNLEISGWQGHGRTFTHENSHWKVSILHHAEAYRSNILYLECMCQKIFVINDRWTFNANL